MSKIVEGYWIELIPRVQPMPGHRVSLVGQLVHVDLPWFSIQVGRDGFQFRLNENEDIAVRIVDRAVYEVGRVARWGEVPFVQ